MRSCTQIEPLSVNSDKFKPLGSQMLVKYEEDTESEGGIQYVVPSNTWWADVLRVGPECTVEAGDRVLMAEYRGENINLIDGEFTVVNERDAMLVEDAGI